MNDRELIDAARREQLREVVGEILDERQSVEAARQRTQQQSEQEELASIRRSTLSPRQKSELIDRIGKERYLQLPWA